MAEKDTENPKPAKSYGRRPRWQWAVIYLIAAVVIYALIYLIFIRDSGSSTGGGLGY